LRSEFGAEFRSVALTPRKNEQNHNVVGEIVAPIRRFWRRSTAHRKEKAPRPEAGALQ
jgi:hypothetical protein